MTVAHATLRTGRQNLPSLHHLSVRCWPGSRPSSHRAQMSEHGAKRSFARCEHDFRLWRNYLVPALGEIDLFPPGAALRASTKR